MNVNMQSTKGLAIPFDHARLDRLMEEAGIDVVLATSKHNVHYLLGGHRAHFFDYMDATGVTRYLPVFVYPKGQPERAAYIGHRLEKFQHAVKPKRIAVEFGFLPYNAANVLRQAFPDADWVDALFVLERQRAKKSPDELMMLKVASEAVISSMQAV